MDKNTDDENDYVFVYENAKLASRPSKWGDMDMDANAGVRDDGEENEKDGNGAGF